MIKDWLTLYFTPQIGIRRFHHLLQSFTDIHEILSADNQAWQAIGIPQSAQSRRDDPKIAREVEISLAWLNASPLHHIITLDHALYPPLLKTLPDAPPLLFIKGNPTILSEPQLSIVGTRHPTEEGKRHSHAFARELSMRGFVITSGLAMGVDGEAHRAVVEANNRTIGVLGTGLESIYPKRHQSLSESMIDRGGALVSEFPLGTPPKATNFPRRNRIIAGLSLGTLVVEAAKRSGSLITARLALEYNREVFAIPGSIHNPHAKGTHQLIRDRATLTESVADILRELSGWYDPTLESKSKSRSVESIPNIEPNSRQKPAPSLINSSISAPPNAPLNAPSDPTERKLFETLQTPLTIDELVERLELDTSTLMTTLLTLELEGFVTNIGSGRYQQTIG